MKKVLHHYHMVRHEDLNQYGSVFGGHVLSVIDELAFVACSRAFPGKNFLLRAISRAEFTTPAELGSLLVFSFGIEETGKTSVRVRVSMDVQHTGKRGETRNAFDSTIVMVCVNKHGQPVSVQD